MNEKFIRLNFIQKHNEIIKLKRENKEKDDKIKEVIEDCREISREYNKKQEDIVIKLKNEVTRINSEKEQIEKERDFYKNSLNKIPKFILRIFCGKNLFLNDKNI